MVLCAEALLGLGPGPGSLVARWCSGLARVENSDPANDGLWTPKPGRDPSTGVRISPGYHTPTIECASPTNGEAHSRDNKRIQETCSRRDLECLRVSRISTSTQITN